MKNRGMVKYVSLILYVVFIFYAARSVFAEESPLQIPGPVDDFLKTLNKINLDKVNIPLLDKFSADNAKGFINKTTGEGVLNFVGNMWNKANAWMAVNIGISLSEVIKVVINLVVWVLELALKLIKAGLSYLPV